MMLPWLHTLRKLYSDSSAASHVHRESLVLLSVLRRPTSWAKTSVASQASPSMATPLRWWRISPTLVPPSPATSSWMLHWMHRSSKQWQQWPALQRGSGKTPCWASTQDEGVSSLHAQHTALWQWSMDSVLLPRMQTQCLPSALPQKDFWHHLARLCPKQECPGSGGNTKHVCLAYPKVFVLAWSYQLNAGWPNPQGCAVQWDCHWL